MNHPNRISQKDLFEKIIFIQGKVEQQEAENRDTVKRFTFYASIILILEILNLIVHAALLFKQM